MPSLVSNCNCPRRGLRNTFYFLYNCTATQTSIVACSSIESYCPTDEGSCFFLCQTNYTYLITQFCNCQYMPQHAYNVYMYACVCMCVWKHLVQPMSRCQSVFACLDFTETHVIHTANINCLFNRRAIPFGGISLYFGRLIYYDILPKERYHCT